MAFDPNLPYEVVGAEAPAFNPDLPFETVGPDAYLAGGVTALEGPSLGYSENIGRRADRGLTTAQADIAEGFSRLRQPDEDKLKQQLARDPLLRGLRAIGLAPSIDESLARNREYTATQQARIRQLRGDAAAIQLDPSREKEITGRAVELATSIAPVIASGAAAPFLGGIQMGGSAVGQAQSEGLSLEEQDSRFAVNAGLGTALNLVPGLAAARTGQAIRRAIPAAAPVITRGAQALAGGAEGALVNAAGDAAIQYTESGNVDLDRLAQNAAIGFGVGTVAGGLSPVVPSRIELEAAPIRAEPELDVAPAIDVQSPLSSEGLSLEVPAPTAMEAMTEQRISEMGPASADVARRYPEIASSIPEDQAAIEIQLPDGTIEPAVIGGWQENIQGEYIPNIGRMTGNGWSHGGVPEGTKIITPLKDPAQWTAEFRAARQAGDYRLPSSEPVTIQPTEASLAGQRDPSISDGSGSPTAYEQQMISDWRNSIAIEQGAASASEAPIALTDSGTPPPPADTSIVPFDNSGSEPPRPPADINFKLEQKPGIISQAATKAKDLTKLAARGLDEYVGVLDTRIKNKSPEAYGVLQKYEFNIRNTPQKYKADVVPFLEQANKLLNADDQRRLTVFLNNGEFDTASALIADRGKATPEAVASTLQAFAQSQAVFQDLLATAQAAGIETGALDNYWHRQLDPRYKEEFLNKIGREKKGPIWEAVSQKAEQLGIDPESMSLSDRADITNQVLRGVNFAADGGVPGQFKARGITNTQPFERYYLPYDKSALVYIDKTVRHIERKKLFGNGVDNAGSLGNAIERTREISGLTPQQEADLRDMFTDRFGKGEQPSGALIGGARAAMSVAYLGQFSDAITQVGDFALNPGRYGIADSLAGTFGKNEITVKDIGLEQLGQELQHTGKTAKLIDTVFKTSGFKKVVEAAQNSSLNTSIRALRRLSRTPEGQIILANKYGRAFEGEFPQMLDDLQNGRITDNTKLLALTELTGSQPITLSSMPQGYLANPNGRILYAMKSFAIKSFDLFRREAIGTFMDGRRQWAAGNKKEGKVLMQRGVRNLLGIAAAYAIGGAVTNSAKDLLAGRETDPEELAAGSLLGLVGLSRFDLQNLLKNGPGDAVRDKLMPAYGFGDEMFSFVASGGEDDRIKQRLPWVGDLWYWHGDSGREREQKSRDRRARENDPAAQRRKEIRDMRKAARERQ